MMRIGTVGRLGAAQPVSPGRPAGGTDARREADAATRAGALVVLEGGRSDAPRSAGRPYGGADAGFVAQLIVADDPALRPSRLERTRVAAALYAEAARRLA